VLKVNDKDKMVEVKFLDKRPCSVYEFNARNPEICTVDFEQLFVRNIDMAMEGKHQYRVVSPDLNDIRKLHGRIKTASFSESYRFCCVIGMKSTPCSIDIISLRSSAVQKMESS